MGKLFSVPVNCSLSDKCGIKILKFQHFRCIFPLFDAFEMIHFVGFFVKTDSEERSNPACDYNIGAK